MLIDRNVPALFLLNTTCATTPTPKTIRMNVPKNSASISRNTPRGIGLLQVNHRDTETPRQTERRSRGRKRRGRKARKGYIAATGRTRLESAAAPTRVAATCDAPSKA